MNQENTSLKPVLEQALQKAKEYGADHADIHIVKNYHRSALIRHGSCEGTKNSETLHLSLRVFKNQHVASVSSNHLSSRTLEQLAERACAMAENVPPSPYDGLSAQALKGSALTALKEKIEALELKDTAPLGGINNLTCYAKEAEASALSFPKITKSNGASASFGISHHALATSEGFFGEYEKTYHSLGVSIIAEKDSIMERDYAASQALFQEDLRQPTELGQEAAERASARLGAHKPQTCRLPVFFEKRVSSSLLGHLAAAINGDAIYKKSSFLKDALKTQIFPSIIEIEDNPTLKRGLASRPFDAEGCETNALSLVKNGMLEEFLLDCRTSKLLSMKANGRAGRGGGSISPTISNLTLKNGIKTKEALFKEVQNGMLITELMGNSLNMITGDYSRGATGFMIRNGEIAEPVSGITIAGNLMEMFANLTPANDLTYDSSINAPTLLIDMMSIAGA